MRLKGLTGTATITAGSTQTTVTPEGPVASKTFVLLTPQNNIEDRALWYELHTGNFSVHLSTSRTSDTAIAWLIIDG